MTWTPSVPMTYGDTPREQFYTNNTQPYFRAPHIYVAPAARFMEGRQVITRGAGGGHRAVKTSGPHVYFNDCSDAVLLTSRAGSTVYDRTFMETFIRPGLGAGNWVSRTNYPLTGILPAGPDRIQMFRCPPLHAGLLAHRAAAAAHRRLRLCQRAVGRRRNAHQAVHVSRGRDWKSTTAPARRASCAWRSRTLTARRPGYTLDDCPEIIGDETARIAAWKQGTNLSGLAGLPVRLRFVMKDADLFSIRFRKH